VIIVTSVTVPSMHEYVHERASQQRKPNEDAEHVGLVFGKEQRTSDNQERDQDQSHA
jgi:hypothetical protein